MRVTVNELIDALLLGAPGAAAAAKHLLQKQTPALSLEELRALQSDFEAMASSPEIMEGRAAFREKRKPAWYPPR